MPYKNQITFEVSPQYATGVSSLIALLESTEEASGLEGQLGEHALNLVQVACVILSCGYALNPEPTNKEGMLRAIQGLQEKLETLSQTLCTETKAPEFKIWLDDGGIFRVPLRLLWSVEAEQALGALEQLKEPEFTVKETINFYIISGEEQALRDLGESLAQKLEARGANVVRLLKIRGQEEKLFSFN